MPLLICFFSIGKCIRFSNLVQAGKPRLTYSREAMVATLHDIRHGLLGRVDAVAMQPLRSLQLACQEGHAGQHTSQQASSAQQWPPAFGALDETLTLGPPRRAAWAKGREARMALPEWLSSSPDSRMVIQSGTVASVRQILASEGFQLSLECFTRLSTCMTACRGSAAHFVPLLVALSIRELYALLPEPDVGIIQ